MNEIIKEAITATENTLEKMQWFLEDLEANKFHNGNSIVNRANDLKLASYQPWLAVESKKQLDMKTCTHWHLKQLSKRLMILIPVLQV